jgi:hypothetical protein
VKGAGLDDPLEDTSDYEYWNPFDPYNPAHCINGAKTVYVRRREGKACRLPIELQGTALSVESCPCGTEDYEW